MKVQNKFILAVVVTLIISIFSAVALPDSSIIVNSIYNQITFGNEAKYNISLGNNADITQRYTLYSLMDGQGWNVHPTPLRNKIVELGARHETNIIISVKPLEAFAPGIYNIPLTVESDQGERQTVQMKMYLAPDSPASYLPSITATIDMDEKINPTIPVSAKLFLENRNPLDLSNLKLTVQSDLPGFNKEVDISLPPFERKIIDLVLVASPYQEPKKYIVFFTFEKENQPVKVVEKKIEILINHLPFTSDLTETQLYLKKFKQLTVVNPGNVLSTQEVKTPVTFLESVFSQGESRLVKENSQRFLVWDLSLKAGEAKIVMEVINYRLGLYLLVAVLLFLIFYWYAKSPIVMTKHSHTVKSGDESELSDIKITLNVKNKSSKPIQNVSITDVVPAIANLEKGLELGTLKPHEIKQTMHGTKVIWLIAELDGREHRIITYHLKAKINILGTFSLPRAVAEFTPRKRRIRKAYSNISKLSLSKAK